MMYRIFNIETNFIFKNFNSIKISKELIYLFLYLIFSIYLSLKNDLMVFSSE